MEIHYRALEHYLTKNASNMTPISHLRTQSGRKRQHNKSGSDYDSGESTLLCAYNVRSRVHQPMFGERHNAVTLTKQASAKTTEWRGSPRLWLTPPQKKKPRRYLRGCALGIVSPSGLRPRLNGIAAKARRRCRNALICV